MSASTLIRRMGLLSFLLGCRSRDARDVYQKKDGVWYYEKERVGEQEADGFMPLNGAFARSRHGAYYRASPIAGADGGTFEALSDHYAKDRQRVYHADTHRDAQYYFLVKRDRVAIIADADPATFRHVDRGYARDATHMYYEGASFPVRDVDTFTPLEYGYARDRVTGYYQQAEVTGSDGATFTVLSDHYAKDAAAVFYAAIVPRRDGSGSTPRAVRIANADVASFAALESGYATDSARAYYESRALPGHAADFHVLQYGYAKNATHAFYMGDAVRGADAATFTTLDDLSTGADARDRASTYQQGKKR